MLLAGLCAGIRLCFYGQDGHATPVDLEVTGFDQLLDWLKLERQEGNAIPS